MNIPQPTTQPKFPVIRCAAFLILLMMTIWMLQSAWLIGLRRYPTQDLGTFSKIIAGKINAEILVIGSSRAQHHFDPRIISRYTHRSTYNIGLDGTPIDLQVALLETYLQHNQTPQILLFSLDINTLAGKRDHDIYHPGQYVAHLNQPALYHALKQHDHEWTLYKLCPFIGIARFTSPLTSGNEQLRYEAFRGLLGRPLRETLHSGFASVDRQWTTEFDEYKQQHPQGVTYPIQTNNIYLLREALHKSQNLGTTPILVYSPEYIESQSLTRNRQAIFRAFQDLAREANITFWDYSDTDLSRNRKYLYNSQHLNVTGATLFSQDLSQRLAQTMTSH